MASILTRVWPRQKVFYGWWIVAAGTFVWFFGALTQTFGLQAFFDPMLNEFGWTRAETSLAFSLRTMEWGLEGPLVGFFIIRFGARKMILAGSAISILGFVILANVNSLGTYYLGSLVVAAGWGAGGNAPTLAAVVNWFRRQRGKALAIASTGAAWSGLGVPVMVWLVDTVGWRNGYLVAAAGILFLIVPLSFVIRDRPVPPRDYPDGENPSQTRGGEKERQREAVQAETSFGVLEALRTRSFWMLAAAMSVLGIATSAILVHELTYMLTMGWSREAAGLLVGATALFTVLGRLGFGTLADYMDKRYVLLIAVGCVALGLLLLSTGLGTWWLVLLFLIIWGLGFGGPISVQMALVADYFGPKNFPAIRGLFSTLQVAGSVSGPVLLGWMADVQGSYTLGLVFLAGLMITTVPLLLGATRPRPRAAAKEPAPAALA
ncbi:MAG: MFS transporter [Chloroflexi bacterium]|nr:MFS transporter [Chloroflexota bacterium]